MLEISNLTIYIEDRCIIKDLNLAINKGNKLAIIGEEGNGKSTLLKVILGMCSYASVEGNINLNNNRIGYLPQSIDGSDLDKTVYQYLFRDDEDYYNKINDLYNYLELIKLQDIILKQKINTLSGGEKVKIGILKLLLYKYDILLLDEPTNDLDIETLEWLEKFLNNIDNPIIYVSHDETLLSNTANMILHIEQINKKTICRYTLKKIDYDTYVNERLRKINKQIKVAKNEQREYKKGKDKLNKIMQKVAYQQETISRRDPHGAQVLKKKMHQLKSQEKKLNNKDLTFIPDVEENINIYFDDVSIPNSKEILKLYIEKLKLKDKILSKNINLEVVGREHICIIGKNGIGKSTLLKIVYNNLKNRKDINIGYVPQNYNDILDDNSYVLDFIYPKGSKDDITRARTYLGNMNFTRKEMTGKIKDLSNGTKVKLLFVKLILDKCNVLILDEPTRNISPLSNPVIRKILKDYHGTIISVSHDRKYINEVIDKVYVLDKNGLREVIYDEQSYM